MGLDYYDVSIFATLPSLYAEIAEALRAVYGMEIEAHELPQLLSFGSWIGGDRDGNPYVTPEVTRDAIQLARGHLLLYYQRRLDELIDLVTGSAQQIGVSDDLLQRLEAYVALARRGGRGPSETQVAAAPCDGLSAVLQLQHADDLIHVIADGDFSDRLQAGNFGVGIALRRQGKNFLLPR
jgi:hypothetical protein